MYLLDKFISDIYQPKWKQNLTQLTQNYCNITPSAGSKIVVFYTDA